MPRYLLGMEWLPWQDAAVLAAGSAVATRSLRSRTQRAVRAAVAWMRELAVMFALYGLWQLAGNLSLGEAHGAVDRGRDIVRIERWLHLPTEKSVQALVLGHRDVLWTMNLYYVGLHVAVTGCCLVWVFARHRDRYPAVRNTLALATGASLLVALVPVAPPRLVPGLGLVDTGRLVGPTVYPATARPGLDQLSAMPSVHVAWAVLVAGAVIYVLGSRWRWLAVLYPLATVLVVIATGNHYWLDALVALLICGASAWVVRRVGSTRGAAAGDGGATRHSQIAEAPSAGDEPVSV